MQGDSNLFVNFTEVFMIHDDVVVISNYISN